MRTIAMLFTLFLLALGTAVAQDGDTQEGDAQDGNVVEIRMVTDGQEFYFDPVGVHIEPGTTVRWVLENDMHNTVSYSADNDKPQRIPEEAEGWASPIFTEEGATFEHTFEVEGVYDYFCTPHEALGMVGRIIVGDAEAFPAQDTSEMNFPAAANALPAVDAIMGQDDGRLTFDEQQASQE